MIQHDRTDRRFVEKSGVRTAYLERGAGPALVLVHGVGLNASVWAPQLDEFENEYRVIAYDTLGHGDSGLPKADANLVDYADQLQHLLDQLGIDRAILLGHSMGALIANLFALRRPERVQVLIAANPVYRRPPVQLAISGARARQLEEQGSTAALDEALLRWFGTPVNLDSPRVQQVKEWISRANPQGYARAYRVFTEADPWLDGRLGELSMPALFITGALDPNSTPEMARSMAGEAPFGHVRILPGERHMMAYVSPHRFNAALREFLDVVQASIGVEIPAGKRMKHL